MTRGAQKPIAYNSVIQRGDEVFFYLFLKLFSQADISYILIIRLSDNGKQTYDSSLMKGTYIS